MKKNREQELLNGFYKDFFRINGDIIACYWLVVGIMEFMIGVLLMIPLQDVLSDNKNILYTLSYGSFFVGNAYLQPYLMHKEDKKPSGVSDKLKLLPISSRAVRRFLLRRLVCLQVKLFPIFLALQLLFAWVSYRKIMWGNLLYPFVFGVAVPILVNALIIRISVSGMSSGKVR